MRAPILAAMLVSTACAMGCASVQGPQGIPPLPAADRVAKVDDAVMTAVIAVAQSPHPLPAGIGAKLSTSRLRVDDRGRIEAEILTMAPPTASQVQQLRSLLVQILSVSGDGEALLAWIPADQLEDTAGLSFVRRIRMPYGPRTQ